MENSRSETAQRIRRIERGFEVMSAREDIVEVERVFREMYRCMLAADYLALGSLLADEFTLTHMTGLVQPKVEWLAAIRSRQMAYHHAKELSLSTAVEGRRAKIVGRHIVDATIYGSRARWNLELTAELSRGADRWMVSNVVASTFR